MLSREQKEHLPGTLRLTAAPVSADESVWVSIMRRAGRRKYEADQEVMVSDDVHAKVAREWSKVFDNSAPEHFGGPLVLVEPAYFEEPSICENCWQAVGHAEGCDGGFMRVPIPYRKPSSAMAALACDLGAAWQFASLPGCVEAHQERQAWPVALLREARKLVNARTLSRELVIDLGLTPDAEQWQCDPVTGNWHRRETKPDNEEQLAWARLRKGYEAELKRLRAENSALAQKVIALTAAAQAASAEPLLMEAVVRTPAPEPAEPPHNPWNRGVQRIGRPLP